MRKLLCLFALAPLVVVAQPFRSSPPFSYVDTATNIIAKNCRVGQAPSFATDATAGANLYLCTSTNVWTQASGAGGAGTVNSGTAEQLGYYASTGAAISGNANAVIHNTHLVVGGAAPSSDNSTAIVARTISGDVTAGAHGARDESAITATVDQSVYASFDAQPTLAGSNIYNHSAAFQARQIYSGSGTMIDWRGFAAAPNHTGTGTITNVKEFWGLQPAGTGPITNLYGLYMEYLSRGTNNYAIYTLPNGAAAGNPSLFSGPLWIQLDANNNGTASTDGSLRLRALAASNMMILGYNTTGHYGWLQAAQYGTGYNPVVLSPNGGGVTIGTTTVAASGALLQVSGAGIQIVGAAQPTCDSAHRGELQYTAGATSVTDTAAVCTKDAADTYAWHPINQGCAKYTLSNNGTNWTVNGTAGIAIPAATTSSPVLFALPSKGIITGIREKTTTAWSGTGFTTMTESVGDSVGGDAFYTAASYDMFAAVSNTNFRNTSLFKSASDAGTNVYALITGNQNLNANTITGVTDIEVCWVTLP